MVLRIGVVRTGVAVALLGAVLLPAVPASADPLTFSNCSRHPVCWNDDRRPRLQITSPLSGASVGRAFWVRGWARDNVAIARIWVRIDSQSWRLASGKRSWEYRFSNLSYGRHTVYVRAVDYRRNRKTKSITVTVPRPSVPTETFTDPPAPALPTGSTYGPPPVVANCSVDVSDQLNTWLATIPSNSTILFAPGGCYLTQTMVSVPLGRDRLLVDGQGALFRRTALSTGEWLEPNTGGNRHWRFKQISNLTVRNISVEGTNIDDPPESVDGDAACRGVTGAEWEAPGYACYVRAMEFEHGMAFEGVQGLRVDNVQTTSTWGDGLYFGPCIGCGGAPTRNATVTNVEIDLNGRQGIALSGAERILFDDVSILHSRRAGFDLEPPPGYVRYVEIRNSYVNSWLLAFASAGRGDVSHIYIHHNTINASGVPVIKVQDTLGQRRYNWRVEYNVSLRPRGSPMASMLFENVSGVIVRGNTWPINENQSRKAVEFRSALGTLMVVSNDFTGACWSYNRDSATASVYAAGNTISSC